jgi:hypothetical protein
MDETSDLSSMQDPIVRNTEHIVDEEGHGIARYNQI